MINSTGRITRSAMILIALICQGCAEKHESFEPFGIKVKNQAQLRVGLSTDYPPLVFENGNSVDGMEPEMAKLVAYDLNRKIVFYPMQWEQLIPALTSNDIDVIMSGMSVTRARETRVKFIQPYLRTGQMALVRKSRASSFTGPESVLAFVGRVGFLVDTTGAALVKESFTQATPVALQSVDQGVEQLRNQQIDMFVHDAPTIWRIAGNTTEMQLAGLFWPLTTEYMAWAVRPADSELARLLNSSLSNMKQNGTLDALIKKWIPIRLDIDY